MRVMGRSGQVYDILTVYFDVFHFIAQTLIHGVNQGCRRINRNAAVHPVSGIAIAPVDHLPGHIGTAIP